MKRSALQQQAIEAMRSRNINVVKTAVGWVWLSDLRKTTGPRDTLARRVLEALQP